MDYQSNRALDRYWEIVKEIDNFVVEHDTFGYILATRKEWWDNYLLHLGRLVEADQMMVDRQGGKISGICGWILTDKDHEHEINKTNWKLPAAISEGNILHISIGVISNEGNINIFKHKVWKLWKEECAELSWYNAQKSRFYRRVNVNLKESLTCPNRN